jgi:hypothetical protein
MPTTLLTLDEYMALLVTRQEAWLAEHPAADRRFPPLYEWFIRDGDEALVQLPPDPEPKPKPAPVAKRPRARRSADDIRAEITSLDARLDQLGRPLSDDPAAVRLSNARILRRHHARMDRDLAEYTSITARLQRLQGQLADAEARELICTCCGDHHGRALRPGEHCDGCTNHPKES